MRRSKLEFYEDVINALSKNALTIDGIAFQCNTSCVTLQPRLEFLVAHNLVTIEVSRDNRAFYVLTTRGVAISKTLAITRRLEKLQTHSKLSVSLMHAVSTLSDGEEKKVRHN